MGAVVPSPDYVLISMVYLMLIKITEVSDGKRVQGQIRLCLTGFWI